LSKIIAVYGSPGSGKSAFSVALATQLSKRSNVVLLSTNRVVPMLKVLVPSAQIDRSQSVGTLFTGMSMTQEDICKRILFHPKCQNLGYLAFATGDTPNTYSGSYDSSGYRSIFTPDKMQTLYSVLLSLTDYIIVDCTGNPTPLSDPLGSVALANASKVIELLTADLAGIEYHTAMFPLLRDTVTPEKTIPAFGRVNPSLHPVNEVKAVLKLPMEYELRESAEIADFFLAGQLPLHPRTRDGKLYLSAIKEIKEALKS
jgi:hypothetical protein